MSAYRMSLRFMRTQSFVISKNPSFLLHLSRSAASSIAGYSSGKGSGDGGGDGSGSPRKPELDVGELEGITFKVEPLKREGEDIVTTRARLLYQSRKRGTLETDLLLSTFASSYLPRMNHEQLKAYSSFLDENDWDIYYWATQPSLGSPEEESQTMAKQPEDQQTDSWKETMARTRSGEWPSTKGAFKAAYRPVPERWRDSEILGMLREHVRSNSARGLAGPGKGGAESTEDGKGRGLGRMPEVPCL
ncbi:succinate dehydrogenase assembly factor 2 [Ascosphaera aggregata]|nr:succinate dehydrogenase assembly factor 2 [Ascosphaera aggregata]